MKEVLLLKRERQRNEGHQCRVRKGIREDSLQYLSLEAQDSIPVLEFIVDPSLEKDRGIEQDPFASLLNEDVMQIVACVGESEMKKNCLTRRE